jgi:hypothetical protein
MGSISARISALHVIDHNDPAIVINVKHDAPSADPAAHCAIRPSEEFDVAAVRVSRISTYAASICSASARGMSRFARRARLAISKTHFMSPLFVGDKLTAFVFGSTLGYGGALFGGRKIREDAQKLGGGNILIGLRQFASLLDRFLK